MGFLLTFSKNSGYIVEQKMMLVKYNIFEQLNKDQHLEEYLQYWFNNKFFLNFYFNVIRLSNHEK